MGGTESDCNHRARKVQDRTPAVTMAPEMACIGPEMADFWTVTILKPSQLKAKTGAILDEAIHSPQYVERDGTLLVITKAELTPIREDPILSPWELRAKAIESFYDPTKTW